MLEHPAYSPDLATSDFFLFPKIKEILKGRHFDDTDDIRSNTTATLKANPQNQFQNCFEGWTKRWHQCIASQGECFEGDNGGIQQWGMQHFHRDEFANFIVSPRTLSHVILLGLRFFSLLSLNTLPKPGFKSVALQGERTSLLKVRTLRVRLCFSRPANDTTALKFLTGCFQS